MNVSIVDNDGQTHTFADATAAYYSETTDTFRVEYGNEKSYEIRMGEISELEIFPV